MGFRDALKKKLGQKSSSPPAPMQPQGGGDNARPTSESTRAAAKKVSIDAEDEAKMTAAEKQDSGVSSISVSEPKSLDATVGTQAGPLLPPPPPKDADISQSAYYTAWAALDEPERSELDSQNDMRQMFEALNEADETHNKKSRLRRGLKVVGPYLQRIGFLVDLASPFVSLNPTAATAHGLIKGSIAILTAVCGAGEDLTAEIESFLQRIPAIERINGVVKSSEELPDIHTALVAVYKDLFGFILKLNAIFKRKRFAMTMAINALRPELPGFVSSFNKDCDVLSKLLDAEVFATILQIKEEINDANIGSNLDMEEESLTALRRKLRQRADDACDWIASDDVFCAWKDSESKSSVLVLLGDMGCGKTVTTAFVADKGVPADAVVCSYYITGGTQTAETPIILRSLMWQLIQAKPNMKRDFLQWFKQATTPTNIFRQSSFDDKIRQFLRHALLASKDLVFFVLDALDECDVTVQRELSSLFDDLLDHGAPLKVFISMRHNEEAESMLPKDSIHLEYKTSPEQSRIIAGYLAEQLNIPKEIREQVVEKLSSKAEGSAIWIRMALEYFKKSKIISQTGLKTAMDELLTFKGLTEMYWQLFQKCKADLDENEDMLSIALDTLAVSKRPLTVEELSYAVCIELDREYGAETLQELDDLASSRNFFEIVQPFVHKLTVENGDDQLRLVHHSLRELILRRPAAEWMQTAKTKLKRGERPFTRKPQLEGYILQRCVNYLLYDECKENRLPFLDSGDLLFEVGDVFHDSDDEGAFPETEDSKTERFDPKAFGFGGFYAYAASSWTHHFTQAADDLGPSADQLITLCSKDDPRTLNWIEQWRRPNCSYSLEPGYQLLEAHLFQGEFDPLTVASVYGSARAIGQLLTGDTSTKAFHRESIEFCIGNLVINERLAVLDELLADEALHTRIPADDVLWFLAFGWYRFDLSDAWNGILDKLLAQGHEYLLQDGNAILCGAAGHGALPLVKKLFYAADKDAALRATLLKTDIKLNIRSNGNRYSHQSVGEAALTAYPDIVRFLCEQDGIEAHLHFTDEQGRTVYHKATARAFAKTAAVLLEYWPEGLLAEDRHGDDALGLYIGDSIKDALSLPFLRQVLANKALQRLARETTKNRELSAVVICRVAKARHVRTCLELLRAGDAAMENVLEMDRETGQPRLTEAAGHSDVLLKELCYLLPLAISTDYLFME